MVMRMRSGLQLRTYPFNFNTMTGLVLDELSFRLEKYFGSVIQLLTIAL